MPQIKSKNLRNLWKRLFWKRKGYQKRTQYFLLAPIIELLYSNNISPTVLRSGPYRFFFYAGDKNEPSHIHVERDGDIAKFWLDPIRLQTSGGFGRNEIRKIQGIITENQQALLRSWHDYFSD